MNNVRICMRAMASFIKLVVFIQNNKIAELRGNIEIYWRSKVLEVSSWFT